MYITILNEVDINIPKKFKPIILDEFKRVLSNPKVNKGNDEVEIHHMYIRFYQDGRQTSHDIAPDMIGVSVKYKGDKRDGHFGIQIPINKMVKLRRDSILDSLLGSN